MTRSSPFQAVLLTAVGFGVLYAAGGTAQAQFKQTDLVSDISGLATITDPNLKNTWGLTAIPGASPFWIDNQVTGTSSLYGVTGSTVVAPFNLNSAPGTNFAAIPGGGVPTGPTGIVGNSSMSFGIAGGPALFIFANLNGTISAWNMSNINSAMQNAATLVATTPGALYTGLAINTTGGLLYAANGNGGGSIQVFDSTFHNVTTPGSFVDPTLPPGFVPFNVEDIGGTVYVSYAPAGHGPQTKATAGMGWVATFNEDGAFIKNLVMGGPLASPWGMAIAPTGFGAFGGDLLVGNFSYVPGVADQINAFNATTGKFEGTIDVNPGAGDMPGGLWSLMFGGGGPSGNTDTLFFTDGVNHEADGLFGALTVPEPSTWAMMVLGFGGLALFAARRRRAALAVG